MNGSGETTALITQAHVDESAIGWHRDAFDDVASRLTDPGFPCVFSRNAFRKKLLKFIFVEDSERGGIEHLGEGIKEYVELSRDWDGALDTAYPLVAVFSPDAVTANSVKEYHAFGWKVLQDLHAIDPEPWPDGVDKDPDSESWSMCFNGMPLFVNMSSPGHRVRQSRNLGRHFILVVNPRERFDIFAGDTPSGRRVRSNIRERIGRYDGVRHAAQLGSYGSGALEWTQYGLVEENRERADKCPFTFRGA
ncbi:YqcI/YcgG family protein [Streptomyces sp. NPDC090036]|uniref:YqcI/YcgG family protein n=1 Tax=Streptomyces sp. NPDC090036 TaxID=3365926 RepID=UPI0038292AAA